MGATLCSKPNSFKFKQETTLWSKPNSFKQETTLWPKPNSFKQETTGMCNETICNRFSGPSVSLERYSVCHHS